jgi:hypothetical protein
MSVPGEAPSEVCANTFALIKHNPSFSAGAMERGFERVEVGEKASGGFVDPSGGFCVC